MNFLPHFQVQFETKKKENKTNIHDLLSTCRNKTKQGTSRITASNQSPVRPLSKLVTSQKGRDHVKT